MADLKKPLNQGALDALTLGTDEARAAYQEQRLKLEVGRTIPKADGIEVNGIDGASGD